MNTIPVTVDVQVLESSIPPGRRKAIDQHITFEHTFDVPSYTSDQAPVVVIETKKYDGEIREYRGVDQRCYLLAYEGDKSRTEYSHAQNRFQAARQTEQEWSDIIFIDGKTWKHAGEPCYKVEPSGYGSSSITVRTALYRPGTSGPYNAFNALEFELACNAFQTGAGTPLRVVETLEVLDPSFIRMPASAQRLTETKKQAEAGFSDALKAFQSLSDPEGMLMAVNLMSQAVEAAKESLRMLPEIPRAHAF